MKHDHFFEVVSFKEFFGSTSWYPLNSQPEYGIWPLVVGTLEITVIAMLVAVPIGLTSAIYLSEYASERARRVLKPILEVLAGVPTIVFGFFALTFVTPLLVKLIPGLAIYNALSPGIVVGIMIIPMIASISEDAMSSVPKKIRDGALALGSTRLEVALKVVVPAALSGIIASIVLGMSRAIGETMIVTIAGGSNPTAAVNPLEPVQTMTAYIVQVALGDAGYRYDRILQYLRCRYVVVRLYSFDELTRELDHASFQRGVLRWPYQKNNLYKKSLLTLLL